MVFAFNNWDSLFRLTETHKIQYLFKLSGTYISIHIEIYYGSISLVAYKLVNLWLLCVIYMNNKRAVVILTFYKSSLQYSRYTYNYLLSVTAAYNKI